MTRLIDADALKLSHCKECTLYPDNCLGENCDWDSIAHINMMPTIEAIPIEFIKDLHKEAIEYRDRWRKWSLAWRRADEQAIGIDSVLQVWEDRHG